MRVKRIKDYWLCRFTKHKFRLNKCANCHPTKKQIQQTIKDLLPTIVSMAVASTIMGSLISELDKKPKRDKKQ